MTTPIIPRNQQKQPPLDFHRIDRERLAALNVAEAARRSKRGLGQPTDKGWYRKSFACPCGRHRRDDRKPSCSVSADGAIYCHTTDTGFQLVEAAALLGVTVPESDLPLNRKRRRTAAARTKKIARRQKQQALARAQKQLPRRLRRLYRLLISQSLLYGTVAMSQGQMAERLELERETVNRKIAELRALGWSTKLGWYSIGFDPSLHEHGLDMRVCIESVFHSEVALDTTGKNHTIRLLHLLQRRAIPKFVFLPGLTALIRYRFDDDDRQRRRPPATTTPILI